MTARIALLCAGAALLLLPPAARSALQVQQYIGPPAATLRPQSFTDPWSAQTIAASRDPFLLAKRAAPAQHPTPEPIVVRAIVLGVKPRALIEIGGLTRIVHAGQEIGRTRIAQIGKRGIWLSSGAFVPLESEGP